MPHKLANNDRSPKSGRNILLRERNEVRSESTTPSDSRSVSGVVIKPVYTRQDLKSIEHLDSLPGQDPFLRGPYATMYTQRPWTIRQYAGLATAEDSNSFYRKLLAGGAQGISVAFDLPTQRGYDSDHPLAISDVGKAGVAIDSAADMELLFDGIPLDKTSVSMTINGAVLPVLAAFIVAAQRQGVAPASLSGTIQNDILKEFLIRNTYVYPPAQSMRIVRDVIQYCSRETPSMNSISVSGYHMHEAGAGAAIELAYTLANGLEYLRSAIAAGIDVDDCAPRMSFFFGIGMDFYLEIAKLRAARVIWSRIVDQFEPKNPRSKLLRMHCQTSGWSLTEQDPMNNIVRTSIEAMAGVFGGTQSMHTNSFDEATSLPSETAARIARNTQLILQEESGITRVVDPWGGSYFMENLTHQMIQQVDTLIAEVESFGGMAKAIEIGLPKRRIEESATIEQARIDRGERTIVGVNKYQSKMTTTPDAVRVDAESVGKIQRDRIRKLKTDRNSASLVASLEAITRAASSTEINLVPLAIDAMSLGATVGEISAVLESVWGRHSDESVLVAGVYGDHRNDDPDWRRISERVNRFQNRHGRAPRILICKLGQDGHDRGQRVVASSLADLGFTVTLARLFSMPEDIVQLAKDNDVDLIGVSTLSAGHQILLPELLERLDLTDQRIQVVVGGVIPHAERVSLETLGVRRIFGPSTPIHLIADELITLAEEVCTSK